MSDAEEAGGRVVLAGAPLGNTGDASARLREVLASADVVAAEDTRRLSRLAKDLGVTVTGRVVSYFEGNDERRTPELVEALESGKVVVVVTDGGMPSVSDPGYRLVRAALDAGFPVTSAPGPSAVTTALALSGLPSDRFVFEGFLPRSGSNRRSRLRELAAEQRTLVFFEAPHRISGALEDLASIFGADRPAALCRELTKTYEEIRRDGLGALAAGAVEDPPRGEITLVVAGAPAGPPTPPDDDELRAAVAEREAGGQSRRDAIQAVADAYGLRKREVYALVHDKT
ncbi:16S rRNA (cytidine(1402)-2'-O)-methyltransferase [Actinoplanes couchii]|uniref:Ribosomal RNA small subunit methyltransferase I n=1 Tax=Actinoplanes couchii TaxID=403638 RepID=A0ABQ3X9Y3_9ACTN|nr:16S rRNA (cytidine(1402)-2'-O)-methyltransferase [Actinoplanes couchii]MDR6325076.1 16S rRNA (cytidine1402-2'-O)-methyltransferase [Actinoplanes couchii]GID55300.1 ribosomal RNA small subunit methyltransferase I [Actinoplanes couchii]